MAITLTITVGQTVGAAWNTYTSLTQLNLRSSPYTTATINMDSHLGDGVYKFLSVPPGEYKLYNNTTELTKYGIIKVGEHTAVLLSANNTLTGNNNFRGTSTFDADVTINAGSMITITDSPVAGTDAVNKDYADTKASLTANQTFSGNNDFSGTNTVSGSMDFPINPPTASGNPSTDDDLTRKKYVDDQIAAIVTTPFQESPNVLRLIVDGVTDTNKVYTSFASAIAAAASYASSSKRYTIKIEGAGTSLGTNIDISAVSNPFRNYISLKGINQNIKLYVNDDAYTSGTLGLMVVENLTLYRDDTGAGIPTFSNIIFKDCYFDFNVSSIGFTSCDFRGVCQIKNTGGTVTINSNCKGGVVLTNGSLPGTVVGFDGLSTSNF